MPHSSLHSGSGPSTTRQSWHKLKTLEGIKDRQLGSASGGQQNLDSRSDRPLAAQRPIRFQRSEKSRPRHQGALHTRPRGRDQAQTDVEFLRLSRNQQPGWIPQLLW